jgi:Na+-transporting NADH:ubiquinone oxidoreductase subunit B
MLHALAPIALASVWLFGWRALAVLFAANVSAFVTEYLFVRRRREPVSSAVFVTGSLLALSLPPAVPVWMAVVGSVFGVAFGKMVFGGFGRNVFNPALVGRAFLYVSFPVQLTAGWVRPVEGAAGRLSAWAPGVDALTSATPLDSLATGETVSWLRLSVGNTAGSLGETSALLIALGGAYLLWRRAADWRLTAAALIGFLALSFPLRAAGLDGAADPLRGLLAGSMLFGVFFFVTEPVSAPKSRPGKWIYGALFGLLTAAIRTWSAWPEGTTFAILMANTFAPIIDHAVRSLAARPKVAGAAEGGR